MQTLLKILGHFRAKNFVPRSPLDLNHPCLLTSTNAAKNYDGWWKLECFHKTNVCSKHISDIMCENPRGSWWPSL